MIRVDTHFHPNFSFWLPEILIRRRSRKIWDTFRKRKLDVVFVAEHAYKHPRRSYETLLRCRPKGVRTAIIPAVETVSREGIDMIVFSKDGSVYGKRDILTPFKLPIERLVQRIHADPRLFGVIPHPYAPSRTGFLRSRPPSLLLKEEDVLRFAEKFNGALLSTRHILLFLHLTRLFNRMFKRISRTMCVPARMTPRGITILGGSDAHHVWDLGSYLCIHASCPRDFFRKFKAVINPRH
ncbi:MAG: hypothetical protein AAB728_03525, partial [Patescibacteria group bacterium]